MMLPNEKIQSDAEFTQACKANGKEAVRILTYIAERLKEKAFLPDTKDSDTNIIRKKVNNLNEFMTEITNETVSTTLTLN
ncbi:hypothetical protein BSY48_004420 [Salmonella enterica subsp. enterica serovar Agbeni]|nr:hypothetical protein [Salmonella enterica subsp. enterica serovar Agbeni]